MLRHLTVKDKKLFLQKMKTIFQVLEQKLIIKRKIVKKVFPLKMFLHVLCVEISLTNHRLFFETSA